MIRRGIPLAFSMVACGSGIISSSYTHSDPTEGPSQASNASGSVTGPSIGSSGAPQTGPSHSEDPVEAGPSAPATPAEGTGVQPEGPSGDPASDNPPEPTGPTGPLFRPSECSAEVDAAIHHVVDKYKLPRWFYYAVVHRESSFTPTNYRSDDGGSGLTQLTGVWYNGTPYPQNLSAPNQNNSGWRNNMRLHSSWDEWDILDPWIDMNDVTPLQPGEWADPVKNLERYSSGYAVPMFHLMRAMFPNETFDESLRRVAYHWRYGVYDADDRSYPIDPSDYMPGEWGYDAHVARYQSSVEADDGVFNGVVAYPPYE